MTEKEVYKKIKPYLEGYTEGLNWDFKKTLHDTGAIIRDILAFSNNNNTEDSYIIVGVSEASGSKKIELDTEDRLRLGTDAKFIYIPESWDLHGLNAKEIETMKQFSAKITEQISSLMLISHPKCEYVPVSIGKSRWLYVIVIKNTPGVFLAKKDVPNVYNENKIDVKQGVLYIRVADTTLGAKTEAATATDNIRVWKRYIEYLGQSNALAYITGGEIDE